MKAVVAAFKQEKALVEAFSVTSIYTSYVTADNVMELHRAQERRMYTCGPGLYREHRERRGDRGDPALAREMEELRARTQQMEKTLK